MCICVLQIDFPRYWLQCTMHVQLFNSILTMILQHLQKDQLMCIHPLLSPTALIAVLMKSPSLLATIIVNRVVKSVNQNWDILNLTKGRGEG